MPTNQMRTQRKHEIQERRRQVSALYVRGMAQMAIADRVGVNVSTVCRDLKAVRKEWMAEATRDYDERIAQELAKLDAVEAEAWVEWQRSKNRTRTRTKTVSRGSVVETTETREVLLPDPRYLHTIGSCIDRRCKLLGLDAPEMLALVDWRTEAKKDGFDPATIFQRYVTAAATSLPSGSDEARTGGDGRGPSGG